MAKLILGNYLEKPKKRRKGIHAKKRNSNNKQSKNYVKHYRGTRAISQHGQYHLGFTQEYYLE